LGAVITASTRSLFSVENANLTGYSGMAIPPSYLQYIHPGALSCVI